MLNFHNVPPHPFFQEKASATFVGFANLPNQVFRKAVKRGFQFSLMVVGKSVLSLSLSRLCSIVCFDCFLLPHKLYSLVIEFMCHIRPYHVNFSPLPSHNLTNTHTHTHTHTHKHTNSLIFNHSERYRHVHVCAHNNTLYCAVHIDTYNSTCDLKI